MTLKDFFENDRFAKRAGAELLDIKEGYAKARMLITPQHLNGGGVCQGGAIFTLADLAFAAAVNSHLTLTFSTTSTITYFNNRSDGFIYAEARELVVILRTAARFIKDSRSEIKFSAIFKSV